MNTGTERLTLSDAELHNCMEQAYADGSAHTYAGLLELQAWRKKFTGNPKTLREFGERMKLAFPEATVEETDDNIYQLVVYSNLRVDRESGTSVVSLDSPPKAD